MIRNKPRVIKQLFINKCSDCSNFDYCKYATLCGDIPQNCKLENGSEDDMPFDYGIIPQDLKDIHN